MKQKYFPGLMLLVIILAGGVYWVTRAAGFQLVQDPEKPLAATEIAVDFRFPMRQEDITDKIFLVPENPKTLFHYRVKWLNQTTALISVTQQGRPEGQAINIQIIGAPTALPLIKKSVSAKLRPKIPLSLKSETNLKNIPSRGPLLIQFNTPVDPKMLQSAVILPIPGQLKPEQFSFGNKSYTDYSRWYYYPDKPFRQGKVYTLVLKPGLHSMGGSELTSGSSIIYSIATAPQVITSQPQKNAAGVHMYRNIEITTDKPLWAASLEVVESTRKTLIPGNISIKDNKLIFRPSKCFMPGKSYMVRLKGESRDHEPMNDYIYYFSTASMKNRLWVEVDLGNKHTMTVYREDKIIRSMLASGGKEGTPTPLGTFYTQDRGHSFWSPRFGEGATYWVRLFDQILIHSVPRNHRWQLKEDEHEKLGLPASHGCVRLSEDNARWFFKNIPGGTPVIIHK